MRSKDQEPSGSDSAGVVRFADAVTLVDGLRQIAQIEAFQTAPTRHMHEIIPANLPDVTLLHIRFGAPAVVLGAGWGGRWGFLVPWTFGIPIVYRRLPLLRGTAVALGPGGAQLGFCAAPCAATLLLVRGETAALHLAGRDVFYIKRVMDGGLVFRLPPARDRAVRGAIRAIVREAEKAPAAFLDPKIAGVAQKMLLDAVFQAIAGRDAAVWRASRKSAKRFRIVRAVYDEILMHPDEVFSVTRLGGAAGARLRTLEYAFRDYLGVTPVRFLRLRRLHRVRRLLLAREAPSVKAAAFQCGVRDVGRLSVDYRRLFGESPSATLKRVG